jgi:hypothetical protein
MSMMKTTEPQTEGSGSADAERTSTSNGLSSVVDQLEGVARALGAYFPDPEEGTEWVQYDSAVVDLYRALVSLRAIERERHRAGGTHGRSCGVRGTWK